MGMKFFLIFAANARKMTATMGTRDKRVDAYITRSADFAKPVLRELRTIIHEGCPEVEETIKWSFPNFTYKGMFCGFAAFKEHCSFGFWKGSLILGKKNREDKEGMGSFGKFSTMKDLPPRKILLGYIKKAKQLNDDGVKVPKAPRPKGERKDLVVPPYLTAALKKNKRAAVNFCRIQLQQEKRLRTVGDGSQNRGDTRAQAQDIGTVDIRRKITELEI